MEFLFSIKILRPSPARPLCSGPRRHPGVPGGDLLQELALGPVGLRGGRGVGAVLSTFFVAG